MLVFALSLFKRILHLLYYSNSESDRGDVVMRLVSFHSNGHAGAGLLREDRVFPLKNVGFPDAVSFIAAGEKEHARVESWLKAASSRDLLALDSIKLTAPIPRPL